MKRRTPISLRDGLRDFRQANSLLADEAARNSWTCRIGLLTLRLPNFAWRRHAIEAHDLHHVLTGYPCTMCGEFQMAAWEFGAGRMPHWAAALFCLPLILAGLMRAPRHLFAAFAAGCRSFSLHGTPVSDRVLAASLLDARNRLILSKEIDQSWTLAARFGFLVLRASAVVLAPVAFLLAAWRALAG